MYRYFKQVYNATVLTAIDYYTLSFHGFSQLRMNVLFLGSDSGNASMDLMLWMNAHATGLLLYSTARVAEGNPLILTFSPTANQYELEIHPVNFGVNYTVSMWIEGK